MKSCFFIGHREAPESLAETLAEAIERHITELGVLEFVVGGYGAFDRMTARLLAAAKERHHEINIMLLTPYHPSERKIYLPKGFEVSFYPPGMERVPKRLAIVRANRYMIEHSDCLIAYVWHPASNARELLEYAQKLESQGKIHIENLADKTKQAVGEKLFSR
ncbi:MAG: hypothetical protein IJ364_06125 [Oscillospiraceae bacterium]|nr:hypothetical protein [Oscillospiraceae bacterium]